MEKKNNKKIVAFCIILLFVLSGLYLFVPWLGGFNWLAWLIAILNIITGPAVLIAYILEIRKGVFADDEEAAEAVEEE